MQIQLQEALKRVLYKLGLIADYVVETGTSGIWTYEKWESGKAKCWGVKNYGNISIDTAWGNVYIKSNAISAIAYPFTFLEPPVVNVTEERAGTDAFWVMTGTPGTATQTPSFGVVRGILDYDTGVKVYFEVTGKWK